MYDIQMIFYLTYDFDKKQHTYQMTFIYFIIHMMGINITVFLLKTHKNLETKYGFGK